MELELTGGMPLFPVFAIINEFDNSFKGVYSDKDLAEKIKVELETLYKTKLPKDAFNLYIEEIIVNQTNIVL